MAPDSDLFTKYTGGQPSMTARGSEPNERSQSSEDSTKERGAGNGQSVERAKGKLFGIAHRKKRKSEAEDRANKEIERHNNRIAQRRAE